MLRGTVYIVDEDGTIRARHILTMNAEHPAAFIRDAYQRLESARPAGVYALEVGPISEPWGK